MTYQLRIFKDEKESSAMNRIGKLIHWAAYKWLRPLAFYKLCVENEVRGFVTVRLSRRFLEDSTLIEFQLGQGANYVWCPPPGGEFISRRGMLKLEVFHPDGKRLQVSRRWRIDESHDWYKCSVEIDEPNRRFVPTSRGFPEDESQHDSR